VHFFEVELVKPRRIANDRLLNEIEIEGFVSQVCPCPFSPEFSFGEEIAALLAPHGRAGKSLPDSHQRRGRACLSPLSRRCRILGHQACLASKPKDLRDRGIDGEPAAVGWLIHHDYQGAIPATQGVRGLRARVGNIQVGHDRLFLGIFPEDRFCSWTIGEVHVLDAGWCRTDAATSSRATRTGQHHRALTAGGAPKWRVSAECLHRSETVSRHSSSLPTRSMRSSMC
jgi:hypothetical protein